MAGFHEKLRKIELKLLAIRKSLENWKVLGVKIRGRDQSDLEHNFGMLESSIRTDMAAEGPHADEEMNLVNIQTVDKILEILEKYKQDPQIELIIQYVEEAKKMFEKLYET